MATKFSNGEARFFNQLLNGADFETIYNEAISKNSMYNAYYGH